AQGGHLRGGGGRPRLPGNSRPVPAGPGLLSPAGTGPGQEPAGPRQRRGRPGSGAADGQGGPRPASGSHSGPIAAGPAGDPQGTIDGNAGPEGLYHSPG